jgi:hypothetical protein
LLEDDKMAFEFEQLRALLRRRSDDARVAGLIGGEASAIERDEYYGSIEFKTFGVDLVFKEAPWVLPPPEVGDPKDLYVWGFHFHREGHEGYAQYRGDFPAGTALGDSEADIRRKLGPPLKTGGGGVSSILKKPLLRWLRYSLGDSMIHFQLDGNDRVEMVTLEVESPDRSRTVG